MKADLSTLEFQKPALDGIHPLGGTCSSMCSILSSHLPSCVTLRDEDDALAFRIFTKSRVGSVQHQKEDLLRQNSDAAMLRDKAVYRANDFFISERPFDESGIRAVCLSCPCRLPQVQMHRVVFTNSQLCAYHIRHLDISSLGAMHSFLDKDNRPCLFTWIPSKGIRSSLFVRAKNDPTRISDTLIFP